MMSEAELRYVRIVPDGSRFKVVFAISRVKIGQLAVYAIGLDLKTERLSRSVALKAASEIEAKLAEMTENRGQKKSKKTSLLVTVSEL